MFSKSQEKMHLWLCGHRLGYSKRSENPPWQSLEYQQEQLSLQGTPVITQDRRIAPHLWKGMWKSTQLPQNFRGRVTLCCFFGWDQMWKGFPSYLVPERPREQSVVISFHDNEEQGQVGSFPCPIPVQVHPQAHLVAIFCSVES